MSLLNTLNTPFNHQFNYWINIMRYFLVSFLIQILRKTMFFQIVLILFPILFYSDYAQAEIKLVANHATRGGVLKEMVGPGPALGSERFYQSYYYGQGTLDVIAINPDDFTVNVYSSPVSSEAGAWAMIIGRDNNIYVGTTNTARILKLDPRSGTFTDKGSPSTTETMIWALALGADGKLYGGTYPHAKLVQYDPITERSRDLGVMDSGEQYIRYVEADMDGYVYLVSGSNKAKIICYQISTGKHSIIWNTGVSGFINLMKRSDGKVYASLPSAPLQSYRLTGFNTPELVSASSLTPLIPNNKFQDGRILKVDASKGLITVSNPSAPSILPTSSPLNYSLKPRPVFRLGMGSNSLIYGSGYIPMDFFELDPNSGNMRILDNKLGSGEIYSIVSYNEKLYLANYSGNSPLMIYDPRLPYSPGTLAESNPYQISGNLPTTWRPEAMIVGHNGLLYIGAKPNYGAKEGFLVVWDTVSNNINTFIPVANESPITLTLWNNKIIGGTSIINGSGSTPSQTYPSIFIWDIATQKTEYFTKVNWDVSNQIHSLIAAPNGKVYGFLGNILFSFDPATRKLAKGGLVNGTPIYNSVAIAPDGNIWGISSTGVFKIDTTLDTVNMLELAPKIITGGFAMQGDKIYFACQHEIYVYIPTTSTPEILTSPKNLKLIN
ncbi:MAG: hypothetical protein IPL51_00340 [Candidatus Competibacteraceae bacterium]|nr:hypothetical protein [Candidatus Competibacteraceae bacterium]